MVSIYTHQTCTREKGILHGYLSSSTVVPFSGFWSGVPISLSRETLRDCSPHGSSSSLICCCCCCCCLFMNSNGKKGDHTSVPEPVVVVGLLWGETVTWLLKQTRCLILSNLPVSIDPSLLVPPIDSPG